MDEKIRSIEEQIKSTADELRLITDDLTRMQGELDALKKDAKGEEWPKERDAYVFISDCGMVHSSSFDADGVDKGRQSTGNMFRTKEEAEEHVALLRWLAENPARWRKIQVWREICEFADGGDWIIDIENDGRIGSHKEFDQKSGAPTFSNCVRIIECANKIGAERLKRDWFGAEV